MVNQSKRKKKSGTMMANSNGEFDCRIMTLTTTSNDLKTIQGRVEKFSIPC